MYYLFFCTRFTLLNFDFMWPTPVLAFIALLALCLLLGNEQPCKALMFILPIAFIVVGILDAYLCTVDNAALIGLHSSIMLIEPAVLFGWGGLLLGTLIAKLLPKKDEEE